MAQKKPPELKFQQHIADFLVREHKCGVLEQTDITDTEHFIAEDQIWSFLKATQNDTLKKLTDDYGTDARDEVFKALRKELGHTPLWMLMRHELKVRGLEFKLFYSKPRSAESAAAKKYGENRITFRPHFYFGKTNQEIDFVFFLNGLPIVALELKHEKNQNVHDAVTRLPYFLARCRAGPPSALQISSIVADLFRLRLTLTPAFCARASVSASPPTWICSPISISQRIPAGPS